MGGVHGDGVRNITGGLGLYHAGPSSVGSAGSALYGQGSFTYGYWDGKYVTGAANAIYFAASRVVPTAAKNQPRAWGALACVYLGLPK